MVDVYSGASCDLFSLTGSHHESFHDDFLSVWITVNLEYDRARSNAMILLPSFPGYLLFDPMITSVD